MLRHLPWFPWADTVTSSSLGLRRAVSLLCSARRTWNYPEAVFAKYINCLILVTVRLFPAFQWQVSQKKAGCALCLFLANFLLSESEPALLEGERKKLQACYWIFCFPKRNDPGVKNNLAAFGHPSPICISSTPLFFYPDSFCNKKPETLGKTKGGKSKSKPSYRNLIGTQKPFPALSSPNQKGKEMQLIRRNFMRY